MVGPGGIGSHSGGSTPPGSAGLRPAKIQDGGSTMSQITKEMVRKTYKKIKDEDLGEFDGFSIVDINEVGPVIEDPKGKKWQASGDKRVKIEEMIETKVCQGCGEEFKPSKFTPYQKFCNNCGSRRGVPKPDREDVECTSCGQEWSRSKFLPYITVCPACTKAAKKQRAKEKKAETA